MGLGSKLGRYIRIFVFTTTSRNSSEAHTASYPIGTGSSFPVDKVAGI